MESMNRTKKIVWMQLSAGQGPKECGWVVAQLFKVIAKQAMKKNLIMDCIESVAFDKRLRNQNEIVPDSYRSVLLRIEGKAAHAFANQWAGTIKWHGHSPYRPKHKRINWFVGTELVVVGEAGKTTGKTIVNLAQEVDIKTLKARGPGGQHVNKTSSAVRVIHRPSGITIRMESDRSQHRNRQLAMEKLQLMLAEGLDQQKSEEARQRWLNHYQVQRGCPTQIYQGNLFTKVQGSQTRRNAPQTE